MLKAKRILFMVCCFSATIPAFIFGTCAQVMRNIARWSGDEVTKTAYNHTLDRLAKAFTTSKL